MASPELHLITDPTMSPLDQVGRLEAAVAHGVDAVHIRLPHAGARSVYELAVVVQAMLLPRRIPLVVNDRVDVAMAVNAWGIQLGSRGLPVSAARRMLGPEAPIGASVHDLDAAKAAEADGATWVTFGHVFETGSHPGEPGRGLSALREVVESVSIPVIAIGGITPDRVPMVMSDGAAGVAVITGILRSDDVATSTRAFRAALDVHG